MPISMSHAYIQCQALSKFSGGSNPHSCFFSLISIVVTITGAKTIYAPFPQMGCLKS